MTSKEAETHIVDTINGDISDGDDQKPDSDLPF